MIEERLFIHNYKCFNEEGAGFEAYYPINVIIGKNNLGKSSLLDLIEFTTVENKNLAMVGREGSEAKIMVTHKLQSAELQQTFQRGITSNYVYRVNDYEFGQSYVGAEIVYSVANLIPNANSKKMISCSKEIPSNTTLQTKFEGLTQRIEFAFSTKKFCRISAERDIIPEVNNDKITLKSNGTGAANYIQRIINSNNLDSQLIETNLLDTLNQIINPDIEFNRILVQINNNNHWEIYFQDTNNNKIALSKMGSGIKTILLVLLNLLVRPEIENNNKSNYIFAFEELENNVHPSLQRRLYNFIHNYAKAHNAIFFLTTHSNVVIDIFSSANDAQIIHVLNDGNNSSTSTVRGLLQSKELIEDLGAKASDILQSNGVIWVEGPSDRTYVLKWLSLIEPRLKEGLHFSIMFYGGRLLSNLSFDFEWINENVIPLMKINTNSYIIMDRDGKGITAKLNATKKRVIEEIGENNYWVTKGREIENYLSSNTIVAWLKDKHGCSDIKYEAKKNEKIEITVLKEVKTKKLDYSKNKRLYSSEVIDYITKDELNTDDLKNKVLQLVEQIKKWNDMI